MSRRIILAAARLGAGLFSLGTIGYLVWHVHRADAFNPWNFFGYFTNLSNIFAAITLTLSGWFLLGHHQPSRRDDLVRGAAVLYMSVTGVVYNTLLQGQELGLLIPWVNAWLHIIMPIIVIADWLYQPPKAKLVLKEGLVWLIFPLLYVSYTLIRGSLVHWYPYPFLDPAHVSGYAGVAVYSVGILVAFLALGWVWWKAGSTLKRRV